MRARTTAMLLAVAAMLVGGCSVSPGSSSAAPSSVIPSVAPGSPVASGTGPAATPAPSIAPSERARPDDPLLDVALVDVRDGSSFTLGELIADAPVIVETMAIWCTNCRSQMHEVTVAHDIVDFHSVSIDVDPTEIASDLAAHAVREGFEWPFVLADAALATMLRERFGNEILLPPGMPKLLVRTDGSVELLPIGVLLSAQQLAEAVDG